MFEHSVKVPRNYKIAANIVKKVSTEGGSVKTLLYDNKLRHFKTNALYALVTETIKHAAVIDKIFENCNLFANESRLDPWLAKVLTAELLFGKKAFPSKSKPEQTILSYKEQFEKYVTDNQDTLKTEVVRKPRYVRVNTNLLSTSDAIRAFQDEGYRFIRCTSGSYDDYLKQIQGLTEYDFTQDYHVKTMFVFSVGSKWHDHDLYLENKIILQDKATAMAVHLLAPPAGSVVLDLCAAPGMKTTQLAAFMRNQGKIYAVERNQDRFQTLCDFVEKTGSTCVETVHKDSLEIKRGDYDDVEYILLDPSCSGSGMQLSVHSYIDPTRLAKLTSLQEKFLKHAMNAFPNAKRIVYSTCSLFPEENERVITNIVKNSRAKWRVQEVKELLKGQWNNFGSGMYGSIGARCMYARPDSDFTTGFFLAVLDRDPKDHKGQNKYVNELINNKETESTHDKNSEQKNETGSKRSKKRKLETEVTDIEEIQKEADNGEVIKKKEKKHKGKGVDESDRTNNTEDISIVDAPLNGEELETEVNPTENDIGHKKNKNKRKNKSIELDDLSLSISHEETSISQSNLEKVKKKKKRKAVYENDESLTVEEIVADSSKKKKNKTRDKLEDFSNEITLDPDDKESETNNLPEKRKKKKHNKDLIESQN